MFKLIWTAITGGDITSWIILGLGAVIYSGAVFGSGYAVATHSALKIEAAAPAKAAKAQEKHDQTMHADATKASDAGKKQDDTQRLAIAEIIAAIKKAEPKPQKACDLPNDVSELLNRAGQPVH